MWIAKCIEHLHYVPGIMLNALHILSYLILAIILLYFRAKSFRYLDYNLQGEFFFNWSIFDILPLNLGCTC